MKKRIGITIGEPSGIGAEIILKSLNMLRKIKEYQFIILSPKDFLFEYGKLLRLYPRLTTIKEIEEGKKKIEILEVTERIPFTLGETSRSTGDAAYRIVEKAIHYACEGRIEGIVTAPVCKYAINQTGRPFTGHTEMLRDLSSSPDILMFFVSPELKAGVVTTHLPIKDVAQSLSIGKIVSKLSILHDGLIGYFKIKRPVIGVSSLNPHGGEGGYLGKEEDRIIKPAIRNARKKGIDAVGPIPADTILLKRKNYDAILFMYHDQAMIPVKLLSWGKNVNVTLGLPFIRTSPDHGTGLDIAGKSIADPGSFIEAVHLACAMASERKQR
jgi:4-hydroxythreonine-4-phosphate dehydrogenase